MVIIDIQHQHSWPWKQCVPFLMINIWCLTGSVCYIVVLNFQVFLYAIKNQVGMKQTRVPQYVFMSTYYYHAVLCMAYVHTKRKNTLICFYSSIKQYKHRVKQSKTTFVNGDTHCIKLIEIIHSRYKNSRISFSTCKNPSHPSLWKTIMWGIQTPKFISIYPVLF